MIFIDISLDRYWVLITAQFSHQNLTHLLFNTVAFYLCGNIVYSVLPLRHFTGIFLASGITSVYSAIAYNPAAGVVGMSGAVSGLLLASSFLLPNLVVRLVSFT